MRFNLSFLSLLCMALVLSLMSCKGDQGDIGPAGPKGDTGATGSTGATGEQGWGTQDCASCHTSQLIAAKQFQWENSTHATGGHYDRNQTSCAVCHTSQGFLERAATGAQATAATIPDPLPQNCYTCHQIHTTYTDADWALTQPNPVTFWLGGETADVGKGNLCISCHQARVPSPALPDPATGGTINITSSRYGPHHGAQGMMFTGSAGYELDFGTPYTNSAHTTLIQDACVTCHMATAVGTASGGHTFRVTHAASGAVNTAGCVSCHTDAADLTAKITDTQTEIATLLEELKTKLVDKGLLNPTTDLAIVPQDFEGHEAGALYNYKYVEEDQSLGIHNYKYTKALLLNSIAALQ